MHGTSDASVVTSEHSSRSESASIFSNGLGMGASDIHHADASLPSCPPALCRRGFLPCPQKKLKRRCCRLADGASPRSAATTSTGRPTLAAGRGGGCQRASWHPTGTNGFIPRPSTSHQGHSRLTDGQLPPHSTSPSRVAQASARSRVMPS